MPKRWRKTTIPDPAAARRADKIRRDFTAEASAVNRRWCGDITYSAQPAVMCPLFAAGLSNRANGAVGSFVSYGILA